MYSSKEFQSKKTGYWPLHGLVSQSENTFSLCTVLTITSYEKQTSETWSRGGGTALFRLYAVLNRVYNLTCLCPKQGMVLRAERLKPRLRAVSFFSSPETSGWALWEVERACDWAADKRRVSFPDLRNTNWVNRPLPGHYNVINQHQIIFWTRMLLLSVS